MNEERYTHTHTHTSKCMCHTHAASSTLAQAHKQKTLGKSHTASWIARLWWIQANVFISRLLELSYCFGKAFGEKLSIFRNSLCYMFVFSLPGG